MTAETLILDDVVDYSKPIEGHNSFTIGWLLDSLRKNDKTFIKLYGNRGVKNVSAYDVSGGKGFVSVVLRCTLTFVDSIDSKDVYCTVLKIPGTQSIDDAQSKGAFDFGEVEKTQNRDKKDFFVEVHQFECDFYNHLAPILDAPCPKVFKTVDWDLGKHEGVLHMEDLTLRGKTITFFENINLTQVKNMIRTLAHMHKNILNVDPQTWHGKYVKSQEALADVVTAFQACTPAFLKKCKREKEFEPLISKLNKFATNREFSLYANKQAYKDIGLPSILVHGDMHSGNIMWAIDAEGNIQNELAALVDWQIMHEGSPMSDLARFLTHCCDGVVRRQAESFAIEYYFECLVKVFGGDKSKIPFSFDQLKKAYNYAYLTQCFFGIGMTEFFFSVLEADIPTQGLRDAYYDFAVLKALHLYEDADRLLQGEMKDMFEKYGI